MKRKHNFSAGPSALPLPVLEELRDQMVDFNGSGLSLVEASHRSGMYDEIHQSALTGLREHLDLSSDHEIVLLGGGATLQFAMIPLNFLRDGEHADIAVTGSWSEKARADMENVASATVVFDGATSGYRTLPPAADIGPSEAARYLYLASNETIDGVQWKEFPDSRSVPLVADMSSDILSRRVDMRRFGLAFAGAQKNLGPAGVAVIVIRKDFLETARTDLPAYLSYRTHVSGNSLYNTPPVFCIHALSLVMDWIRRKGGIGAVEADNDAKADLLYSVVDRDPDFFRCPVDPPCRSTMNAVFRLPTEELEAEFIQGAASEGMVGLKGHRSVGGIRVSMYNAVPRESVEVLTGFMKSFAGRHGV
jgi:phosphoserine aminotransferase